MNFLIIVKFNQGILVEQFDYQKVQPINSMSYCHNVISIWVELSDNQKIQKFSLNFLIIRKFNHVWLNFLRLNFLTTSNMSTCQYVDMSECNFFKMKVVPNVIRRKLLKSVIEWEKEWERVSEWESESQKTSTDS